MPLLQVRNFPAELYDAITRAAQAENRSVPQQTIVLLKIALNISKEQKIKRQAILRQIDGFSVKNTNKFPDPAKLTREDRDK